MYQVAESMGMKAFIATAVKSFNAEKIISLFCVQRVLTLREAYRETATVLQSKNPYHIENRAGARPQQADRRG
jgi:hypothetical protein